MMLRRVVALALAVAGIVAPGASALDCGPDHLLLRQDGTTAQFSLEIADTDALRSQGLMFREFLPQFAGMLFIYQAPQSVNFWMRNTPISLDLLFIDETGTVSRIGRDAVPFSEATIPGGDDILMVLEINGGLAATLGISDGAQVQYPGFEQSTAAWPCNTG